MSSNYVSRRGRSESKVVHIYKLRYWYRNQRQQNSKFDLSLPLGHVLEVLFVSSCPFMFVHASLHLELWYDAIETQLEHKMRSRITDNGESGIRRRSKNPFRFS